MNTNADAGLYAAAVAIPFVAVLMLGTSVPLLAILTLLVVCPLTMLIIAHGLHAAGPVRLWHRHAHGPHHRFSSSQGSE